MLIPLVLVLLHRQLQIYLIDMPYRHAIDTALEENSRAYVHNLNTYLADLLARADLLSKDKDTLATLALPENSPSLWTSNARVLEIPGPRSMWLYGARMRVPEAREIYLFAAGQDSLLLKSNFVAERLHASATRGEKPHPRAARVGRWSIYVARPVTDGSNTIKGVLLLEIKPESLLDQMTKNTELKGKLDLVQTVPGFPAGTIFTTGTAWQNPHTIALPTTVPDWHLHFTGDDELLEEIQPSSAAFYIVFILVCLASATGGYWLVRRNLVYPKPPVRRSSTYNPMDDLFTQRHQARKPAWTNPAGKYSSQGTQDSSASADSQKFPSHVFRDYDIRGKALTEITGDFAYLLGKVLGTMEIENGGLSLIVCADGRKSSPVLKKALISGIASTGCNVTDIGEGPTPLLNFAIATQGWGNSGVMVTASHNPKEDNGFKIIIDNRVLSSEEIKHLCGEMLAGDYATGLGSAHAQEVHQAYITSVTDDIVSVSGLNIVIDCGNGIAGTIAPELFRRLGCTVTELFTEVDGEFPNHPPDPTEPANLAALIATVDSVKADLGLAFDGDGDRLVAVTRSGRIVWPDQLLMIFARDIVTRNPGADVVFDVKSSRHLRELVASYGGRPIMWKTGHAHIRNKVRETGSPLGGEFSGHIFFNDRWYGFDDGLYAAARLLEIMSLREQSLDDIVASLPKAYSTPEIRIPVADSEKQQIVGNLIEHCHFGDAHLIAIDGLRVEFGDGWGLVRASNTTAALTLRFEADSARALERIMAVFREQLHYISPRLPLDF